MMRTMMLLALTLTTLAATAGGAAADQPAPTDDPGIPIETAVFGALKARSIGPATMSGRVAALDAVASDPRLVYVGAASGGVWKSDDGAVTFEPVFDDHDQSIGAIAIDQARPDTVWVGTGEPWVRNSVSVGDGVYRSTDGGESWHHMGLARTERIGRIALDPVDSSTVYVAALGHLWNANEDRGLYRTRDGGESWQKVLHVDEDTGCADVAVVPGAPSVVFAAMWEFRRAPDFFHSGGPGSGLYRSVDGGETWERLAEGLPEGELGRIAIAVSPARPGRVYALVESQDTALYRSDDLGTTWQRINEDDDVDERPFYFGLVVADPVDPDRVYKPGFLLRTSSDAGEDLRPLGGWVHVDYHALWIDPGDPEHLICGNDGGVYVSYDRGGSWRHCRNLPISQFYRVAVDQRKPYHVYGGLQDNGSWTAPSRSPGGIENGDWDNVGGGDGFETLPDPRDPTIVYWQYQGGNLARRHMDTGDNKDIQPKPGPGDEEFRWNWNTPLVTSPTVPERLYTGSQYLFRSTDRGDSWERLSGDLTTDDPDLQRQHQSGGLTIDNTTAENHCTIYTISESPHDPAVIWVGTDDGQLQVTDDGGESWREVSGRVPDLPDGAWVSCVEAGRHDRRTAYVTFDDHRRGDMAPYVYVTRDLGETWQPLVTGELEGYAHVIRQDPVRADLLFLGTESGLFISLDRGRHWAHYDEDFPHVSVRDLAIQARDDALVIGTHGRGIWIIDDYSPLRQITAEGLARDVFLLESPPAFHATGRGKAHSPGSAYYVAGNPSRLAKIIYFLKKRHMFGDMNIE
ncbi:glycosyl hydrolase, partial [bacterium]|nr:glycosyl hydrolase [bacterium]